MSNSSYPYNFGADPAFVQWKVVRGDTSKVRVEFYEVDGETPEDISGWTFLSTVYNVKTDDFDTLTVQAGTGYVDIIATPAITGAWGTGQSTVSTELRFDLQVTINSEVWTPVIGKIVVISDVSLNP
jgi:hypothetical protein